MLYLGMCSYNTASAVFLPCCGVQVALPSLGRQICCLYNPSFASVQAIDSCSTSHRVGGTLIQRWWHGKRFKPWPSVWMYVSLPGELSGWDHQRSMVVNCNPGTCEHTIVLSSTVSADLLNLDFTLKVIRSSTAKPALRDRVKWNHKWNLRILNLKGRGLFNRGKC